jgi:cytoskeleton protein RodZ
MQQNTLHEDELYYTDASAGEILRHTREHYNQTLLDIEKALRIRASQIDALEKNDYENLPGRVYVIGFVRSYAEYLGLYPERMVNLYKSQMTGHVHNPQLHFPAAASDNQLPGKWILIACAVLLIAVVSIWTYSLNNQYKSDPQNTTSTATQSVAENMQENPQFTDIEPSIGGETDTNESGAIDISGETLGPENLEIAANVPQDMTNPQAAALNADPTATIETEQPVVVAVDESIKINLLQNSWVEIRDIKGGILVSRVLNAGEVYELKDRNDLLISIGNAGGVEFILSGNRLGAIGKMGEVVRNFPINYQSLQEKYGLDLENAVNQAPEQ